MKKVNFLIIFMVLIGVGALSATSLLILNKKKEVKSSSFTVSPGKELEEIRSKLEQAQLKNEMLAQKNTVLEERMSSINKVSLELQAEREEADKKFFNILEEKKELEGKLKDVVKTSEDKLQTEKEAHERQTQEIINKYTKKIDNISEKIQDLKNQSESLSQRKDVLEGTVDLALADAGKEKLKFHYYQEGLSYELNHRYSDAIKQYKKVLRIDPDNAETCLQLASIYTYNMQDFKKAEYYAKRYAKLKYIESVMPAEVREVKTANTKIPLPFLKEKLAEVSFAKVDLETRVTEMKRSFKEKQEQINKLKIRSRKKEAIESELQKLEEAFKKETLKFHYNLALIYDRNKDYNKAVNEYLEALKISPNDADSHYNLAVVYDDHLQDKKKAIEHYKKYLDIRPDSPDAKKVEYWITRAEGDLKSEGKVFFPRK